MSNQDPSPTGGYPAYGTPPPPGHPAFAPYGTPVPEQAFPTTPPAPQYGAAGYPPAPQYGAAAYPPAPRFGAAAYPPAAQYGPPVYPPAFGPPGYLGTYGAAPTYAHWGLRVGALLLDLLAYIPYWIGAFVSGFLSAPGYDQLGQPTTTSSPAGDAALVIGGLVSIGLWVWNRGFQQARTGQSWGKKAIGLRLAREATGENVGVMRALLRDLAHWFDCWILGLGFWFPLWDAKRQTFADKIAKTVSVR